ncbi:MAG: prepilin-type N-terminal cleavage/methylation domain-containing protein [Akkermansiaceae bacterium]|nr:prepilin-type N-terminal cleavage/methylation domain-containing protein [Akkermansiaceae bacterium]
MKKSTIRHSGFSLVEILVVLSIIIVLAGILLPTITRMKDGAAATTCAANIRQCVVMGNLFASEQNGCLPRLHIQNSMMRSHTGKDPLPENDRIVNNANVSWWPDQLTTYAEGASYFSCPKVKGPATKGSGGAPSKRVALGIGINYPSMAPISGSSQDGDASFTRTRLSSVPDQSKVVWFTDAAAEVTGEWKKRADLPNSGSCFIRGHTNDGVCAIGRHGGKMNVGFVDGHVELVNPNQINWGTRDTTKSYVGYTTF